MNFEQEVIFFQPKNSFGLSIPEGGIPLGYKAQALEIQYTSIRNHLKRDLKDHVLHTGPSIQISVAMNKMLSTTDAQTLAF